MKLRPAVALLALLLAACGTSATSDSTSTSGPAQPTPTPALGAPAIVQVENSPAGRPQSGLGAANIVYEYVAEGGVGRFSLIFFGPPPQSQRIGPIRSARTVTVQLAQNYGAVLAYSGASTYILGLLQNSPLPSYNEDTAQGNLFRVTSRAAPHNLYTDGKGVAALLALAAKAPVSYQLWPRTHGPATDGTPVVSFTVPVSQAERPVFTWHPELSGFTRTEDTGVVNDPDTGKPLVIPTVIVQQVGVTPNPQVVDVDGVVGVDHAITGSGNAQIFIDGRQYAVKWNQPDTGPPQFTQSDGSPARIGSGEVWIALVPTGQPAIVR